MNETAGIVANGEFRWREILAHHKNHERMKTRARRHIVHLLKQRYPGAGIEIRVRRWAMADWIVMRIMRSYEKKLDQRTRKRRSPYALYSRSRSGL